MAAKIVAVESVLCHKSGRRRRREAQGKELWMNLEKFSWTLRAAAAAGFALSLSGCGGSAITYGTGKSPGVQTIEDLAGIVALSGKEKEPVDYSPRPTVVAPPSTGSLPPPGEQQSPTAVAANWPKDPDEFRRKMKAKQDADNTPMGPGLGQAQLAKDPKFSLPETDTSNQPWDANRVDRGHHPEEVQANVNSKEMKKLFADAKRARSGSVDANGNPVRKYLTEPPVTYREPDPTAPTEIAVNDKPKKKKFSWSSLWPF